MMFLECIPGRQSRTVKDQLSKVNLKLSLQAQSVFGSASLPMPFKLQDCPTYRMKYDENVFS